MKHLLAAYPNVALRPETWDASLPETRRLRNAAVAAEKLRPRVVGAVDPTADHWKGLQVTLYQHAILTQYPSSSSVDFDAVFSAESLHEFAHLIVSAPFFHPTPLVCKKDPVSVLLQKCVPNRCQLRSLVDEISSCMNSHPTAREFLERSVLCSLLGLYPGSTPPDLHARWQLVTAHASQTTSSSSFESVVATLLRLRCQQTLFFALKESLIYLVNRCNHAVRVVLEEHHGWQNFCELVTTAMNRARASLTGDFDDLERFERTLAHVSKQKIRRLFSQQPSIRDWESVLTLECEKTFERASVLGRSHNWELLQRAALRVPNTEMPLHWLRGMAHRPGDTREQCLDRARRLDALVPSLRDAREAFFADGNKTKLRQALEQAGSWDDILVEVASLADVFRHKRSTHFVTLPASVTVEQIRALRRAYNVEDGTPLSDCPPLMGVCGVCVECDTLRSFLTPKLSRSRASNGLVAFGYSQSLVDDETGIFYCGRKPASADRENSSRGCKTGRALRMARFYGKNCCNTPLTSINLIGRVLVFRGRMMISICCFCGNFFCIRGTNWHGASLCCNRCVTADGRKLYESTNCDWCGKQCRTANLTDVWTSDKKKRSLCKVCSRPAFSNAPSFSLDWKAICDDLTGVNKSKRR